MCSNGRLRSTQIGFQIVFGNPRSQPRAADLAQIDVILARHFAHQRRQRSGGLFHHSSYGSCRGSGCRCGCRRGCWRCLCFRRGRNGAVGSILNAADHSIDADGLAFLHQNLGQHTGARRGNFSVDFVGRDLKQRLVALHVLARLLEPLSQRSFDNTFAHLGHYDIDHIFSISRANTSAKLCASAATTCSRVAADPIARIEVTGLVNPHGTMYRK